MRSSVKRFHKHIKNHFVPHKGNGHHPHLLRHPSLVGFSALLISIKAFAFLLPFAIPGATYADVVQAEPVTETALIAQTNAAREQAGLPTLKEDRRLALAAQTKAEDMAKHGYFAHTSPAGKTALDLIRQENYPVHYAAENLAVHFVRADEVQQSWMNSPTHRLNILDPRYQNIGVGIANGVFEQQETTFVVELFGSQRTTPAVAAELTTHSQIPGTAYADESLTSPFSTRSLDNLSREVFLYAIAFLTALMILTLAVRFRAQHIASMSHAMAVIGLAAVLMLV